MTCVVPGCNGKGLLSFPENAAEVAEWLNVIPKGDWSLSKESKICVRHFDPTDLIVGPSSENEYGDYGEGEECESDCDYNKNEKEDRQNGDVSVDSSIKLKTGSIPIHSLHFPHREEPKDQEVVLLPEPASTSGESVLLMDVDDDTNKDMDDPLKDDSSNEKSETTNSPRAYQIIGNNGKLRPKGLKCCVPQCSSSQGTTVGVGFHAFPRFGETRISVRTMENKTVVHDLHLMWKSLLSVNKVSPDSFVCTKHFTPHNYTNDTLNKTAVPTQFLPNPMAFAPLMTSSVANNSLRVMFNRDTKEFQIDPSGQSNRNMVRIVGRQGVPPLSPLLSRKPSILPNDSNLRVATGITLSKKPMVEAKLPSFITPPKLPQITISKVSSSSSSSGNRLILPKLSPTPIACNTSPVRPGYQGVPPRVPPPPTADSLPKPSLTCSVAGCKSNPHWTQNLTLFRLPRQIEKAREWCYLTGHPEWLDQGLNYARIKYRICSNHFTPNMFHNNDKNVLEGWAHPAVEVKASHSKCEVESCLNFFDVDRINHFNVTFFLFPTKTELKEKWISAIMGASEHTDVSSRHFDDKSIVCSAHFKNADFLNVEDPPTLRLLKPGAFPSQRMTSRQSVHSDKEYMMAAVKLSTNPIPARRPVPRRQSVSPPYLRPLTGPSPAPIPPPKTTGRNRRCTYRGQVISSWSKVFSEDWYNSDEEENNTAAKRIRRRSSSGSKSGGKNDSRENESDFTVRIKEEMEDSDECSNNNGVPDFTVTLTNGARTKQPPAIHMDPGFEFSPVKIEPSDDNPADDFTPMISSIGSLSTSSLPDHGSDMDFLKSLLPALSRLQRERKENFKKDVINCLNKALSS